MSDRGRSSSKSSGRGVIAGSAWATEAGCVGGGGTSWEVGLESCLCGGEAASALADED